jgi:hypothetical protein
VAWSKHGKTSNTYEILLRKLEWKRPLGTFRLTSKDNNKMYLKKYIVGVCNEF